MTGLRGVWAGMLLAATVNLAVGPRDWPTYGGGPADIRYSRLDQINRSNVAQLQVAWTYDTADGPGDPQTEPIVIDGVLYGVTPKHKVIALDSIYRRDIKGEAGRKICEIPVS